LGGRVGKLRFCGLATSPDSATVLDAAELRRTSGEQGSLGIPDPAAHAHQAVGGDGAFMVYEQPLASGIELV